MTSAPISADNSRGGDPSMEEILASIRRIIADEQAQANAAAAEPEAPPVAVVQPLRPVPKPTPIVAPAVQEFDEWLASNSNASVALRPSISAVDQHPQPEAAAPAQQAEERFEASGSTTYREASTEWAGSSPWTAVTAHQPDYSHVQATPAAFPPAQADNDSYAPVAPPTYVPTQHIQAPAMGRGHVAPVESVPEPLVSAATGLSVQSSLQALAQTVFVQDQGMISDAIRDMLRPMLKQWLDDHLPLMVEKIVRAEIERVARGGR